MRLLVDCTKLVDFTKDFNKVVDITKLVNITKVVAISLLDRDGLRPSCELRRASKPVRFPFPLKERIQDCEFPDVYQIICCSLYKLREVEQNVKSEVKTKHSNDK